MKVKFNYLTDRKNVLKGGTMKDSKRTRRDYLENELSEKYLKIDRLISQRKFELERKYEVESLTVSGMDDNSMIQNGTKINSSELKMVNYASDRLIEKLEEFQRATNQLLKNLEPDDQKIFYLRWGKHTQYDWMQIWHIMQSGETGALYKHPKQIYRRREVILDSLAELLYM